MSETAAPTSGVPQPSAQPTGQGGFPPPPPGGFGPGGPGGHGPEGHGPGGHGGPIADAATALGMQPQDVFAALQQGQSLADVAATKGMTAEGLIAAMKAAMPAGMPTPPDDMLTQLVNTKGLPERPDGRGPGGPGGWAPRDAQAPVQPSGAASA